MKIYQIVSHKGLVVMETQDLHIAKELLPSWHPSYEAKIVEVEMTRAQWLKKNKTNIRNNQESITQENP